MLYPTWLAVPFVVTAVPLGPQVRKEHHLCLLNTHSVLAGTLAGSAPERISGLVEVGESKAGST